jgi:hypothetical protein
VGFLSPPFSSELLMSSRCEQNQIERSVMIEEMLMNVVVKKEECR